MLAESLAGLQALQAADLVVTDPAGSLLLLGTDYEVTGNLRTGTGSIRTLRAFTAGAIVTVKRRTARLQEAETPPHEPLPSEAIERELDRRAMIEGELFGEIAGLSDRALKWPAGQVAAVMQPKANFVGKYFVGDANGDPIPASGVGADAALRGDLANPLMGASLVSAKRMVPNAAAQSVRDKLDRIIDAADFGVVGNPVMVDDTIAMQYVADFLFAIGGGIARLPQALRCGQVELKARVALTGQARGPKTKITANAGNYDLFKISGSDCSIEHVEIIGAAKTGGFEFRLACGNAGIERIYIGNVLTWNSKGFLGDSGATGTGVHTTVIVEDCQARLHRGPGIALNRSFAFFYSIRNAIDYVNQPDSNYYGIAINGAGLGAAAGGVNFIDTHVLGTIATTMNATQRGWDIRNLAAVWLTTCGADNVCEIGMVFYAINGLYMDRPKCGLGGGHGIWLEFVINFQISSPDCYGRNYTTPNPAGADGIRFVQGCSSGTVMGGWVRDFTGHGINKAAAQAGPILIVGVRGESNTGRGARSRGSSSFVLHGCLFYANTAGDVDLDAGFDYAISCVGNSGVPFSSPVPNTGAYLH